MNEHDELLAYENNLLAEQGKRDGRSNSSDQNSANTHADTASHDRAHGANIPSTGRATEQEYRVAYPTTASARSTDKGSGNVGSGNRRFGNRDSSVAENDETTGRPVIPSQFSSEHTRPREKAKKTEQKKEETTTLPWFKQQKVLSSQEAQELEEPLKAVLSDCFQYSDEYIWYKTQDKDHIPIWSDADEEELTALARAWLKRGQRSPAAAMMVRAAIAGDDYFTALIFIIPRTIETVDRLKNAPKVEKAERKGRRERYANKDQ